MSRDDYRSFRRTLDGLEADGRIVRQNRGRYAIPEQFDLVPGRLQTTRKGDGFVIPDEAGTEDVFVPARLLATAVDGDRVLVRIEKRPPGRNPAGRIVRVVERAWERIAGVYHRRKGYGVVVPIEPDLGRELLVPAGAEGEAREGDVVAVAIDDWGENGPSPVAHVEEVLGRQGEAGVDVLAIVVGHQLPLSFPEEVETEAAKIARRGIRPEDLQGRLDLRDRNTFTIDPADARDHDDALHVEFLDNGELEIGVHIADVGWYVKQGTAIDREAEDRATSVYLVDRVIPMLPEELSSGLCSLVPDEDRLTVSVMYRFTREGELRDARPERTVIRSRHRLSYEEAEERRTANADADPLARVLEALTVVSRRLRAQRADRGSIDFALPETAVEVDDDGIPVRLSPRPRLETHRIVEDFMVKTNEVIAELSDAKDLPVLYRIHEPPSEDRLENLRRVAGVFHAPIGETIRPADVARLVDAMAGRPQEFLVSTVALRSMKQARYSPKNLGHFGLGSEAYLHFTSPIRRYPDLVVHRALVRHMAGKKARERGDELERLARHTSERERRAVAAERDSVELKKIEYMTRHLGDEFLGTISGVTGFGLFVLLDDVLVEGLIRVSSLVDDYYHYDETAWSLTGRRSGRRLRLGDRVEVQLARVDPESREIDLELLSGPLDPGEGQD